MADDPKRPPTGFPGAMIVRVDAPAGGKAAQQAETDRLQDFLDEIVGADAEVKIDVNGAIVLDIRDLTSKQIADVLLRHARGTTDTVIYELQRPSGSKLDLDASKLRGSQLASVRDKISELMDE